MTNSADVVTVERLIAAPPEAIFELISHPDRHQEMDGSGTVRDSKGEGQGQKMSKGSTFGMSMKMGMPYSMVNTVIEYEEGRRLAWQTRGPGFVGKFVGGRIWRYELEPTDGGTLVKESWDISEESAATKLAVKGLGDKTKKNMAKTLERIEQIVTA